MGLDRSGLRERSSVGESETLGTALGYLFMCSARLGHVTNFPVVTPTYFTL